jgi:hypothetical protein
VAWASLTERLVVGLSHEMCWERQLEHAGAVTNVLCSQHLQAQ